MKANHGRWMVSLGGSCLGVFLLLVVMMKWQVSQARFVGTEDLLAELSEAEFVEEAAPIARDWPQWLGARRDGVVSMPKLATRWSGRGPKVAWRKTSEDSYSSFAVGSGRVYTMVAEEGREAVVCWDLANGEERWKHQLEAGRTYQYGGPRATPTVSGDRLYVLTQGGVLLCLETASGKVVWSRDLVAECEAVPGRWGFACSPLVEDGRVYVALGGKGGRCLGAFRAEDGSTVWLSENDPVGYSSPVSATLGGVKQVIFFTGRRILGVTAAEGSLLWEFPWPTEFEVNAATPVVIRARIGAVETAYVFVSSGYGKGCALLKIEQRDGGRSFRARRVYESDALCCHFSTPVRFGDHVYGLDEKRDLTCLNLRTGEVAWRFEREEETEGIRAVGFKKGSLIRVDDRLIVLGEDGKLAVVKATPDRYEEIAAARPFRERCWTVPVLAEGRLLVRDWKRIVCMEVGGSAGE